MHGADANGKKRGKWHLFRKCESFTKHRERGYRFFDKRKVGMALPIR